MTKFKKYLITLTTITAVALGSILFVIAHYIAKLWFGIKKLIKWKTKEK